MPLRTITWKVHLSSSPAEVYRFLATPAGRRAFWAESAEENADGTDLVLTEEGVSEANWTGNRPGWVSVLLNFKAAADHGVDLRNHDPERSWESGYVDV